MREICGGKGREGRRRDKTSGWNGLEIEEGRERESV
jgi:hypothetical protein